MSDPFLRCIPEMFRADLVDYKDSGYDRGHLVASANQRETALQNSETFLLSNALPQKGGFNRQIWKALEIAVRDLCAKPKILETYVICGPVFYFDRPIESIGADGSNKVTIPIPHTYFKSVLIENNRGTLKCGLLCCPMKNQINRSINFRFQRILLRG